jgi:translation initiation factor 2B subunit (eIF-2B alpha/beta/delta family)
MAIARAPVGRSAAATGALAAGSLADLVDALAKYAPEGYPDAVDAIADELLRTCSAVAPLVVLANAVHLSLDKGPEVVAAELRETERRMAASSALLAGVGAGLIEDGFIVLTHGGSGSVQAMLVRAAEDRRFFVSCAATLPTGEGIELAADLAAAGLSVEVTSDDESFEVLADADLVVVGADALGPSEVMSTVGTAALAAEARELEVPFYVLAALDKALPSPLFDRAERAGRLDGRYEAFPLSQVTAVITEIGVIDSAAAGRMASERQVSPDLLAFD